MRNMSGSRKIFAIGSLILGVLLLLWPGSALRVASYAVGAVIMGAGVVSLITYFRNRRGSGSLGANLFVSVIVICVGGWIFLNPEDFASIIPTAIGYLIGFSGIVNLLETFTLSRAHYRKWWVSLLVGIMTIFMGMLLVNHAFGIASTMVRIVGVFLLFNGLSDLWINERVDEYVDRKDRASRKRNRQASAGGSSRYDTSSPDIIDAENYREIKE